MTTTALPHYATTPCRSCGTPIVIVTNAAKQTIALDPALPVFHRVVDMDSEPRGASWVEDVARAGEGRQAFARHRCAGGTR